MELIPGSVNPSFGYNINNFTGINNNLNGFANLNSNHHHHHANSFSPATPITSTTSNHSYSASHNPLHAFAANQLTAGPSSTTSNVLMPIDSITTIEPDQSIAYAYETMAANSSVLASTATSGPTNMPVISLFKLKSFLTTPKLGSTKLNSEGNLNEKSLLPFSFP